MKGNTSVNCYSTIVPKALIKVLEDAAASGTRIRYWEDQSDIWGKPGLFNTTAMGIPEVVTDARGSSRLDIRKLASSAFVYKLDLSRIYKVTAGKKTLFLKKGYSDPVVRVIDAKPYDKEYRYCQFALSIDGEYYDKVFRSKKDAEGYRDYLLGASNRKSDCFSSCYS